MTLITLEDAKGYLRVDTSDEDALIGSLLLAAGNLCKDVARLTDEQWADIDSEKCCSKNYSRDRMTDIRETMRVAILYTLAYLYEHREEADHHALTLTLRSLLFGIREGVV
jgi:hypothetical protein